MKSQSRWLLLLKMGLSALLFIWLYSWMQGNGGLERLSNWKPNLFQEALWPVYLLLILALSFLNWITEAKKFRILLNPLYQLTKWKSLESVYAGVFFSLFLPNRTGEFAGRLIFAPKNQKQNITAITLLGGIAQLVITLLGGLAGILIWDHKNQYELYYYLMWFGLAAGILTLFVYLNPTWIISAFWKGDKLKNKIWMKAIQACKRNLKIEALLWSFLRYIIFCFQFVLILDFFEIEINQIQVYAAIAVYFQAQTLAPSIFLADLGIRGALAITLFSHVTDFPELAAISAWILWAVNLFIPGFIGWILILSKRKENP